MTWFWPVIAVIGPTTAALAVAWPFWRRPDLAIVGNALGAGIIFAAVIALIGREYVEIQRQTFACLEAGRICSFSPEPFTRFAIYGLLGLCDACVLFTVSMRVEERLRSRSYASEWRRGP